MTSQVRLLNDENTCKAPPKRSRNVFTDIKYFLIDKPAPNTVINFYNKEEKKDYTESILQRIDIDVDKYKIINIHRIGIEAPASYVFDELLKWSGDSSCWPNHIAKVYLKDNDIENIQIYFLGRIRNVFKLKNGIFGFKLLHLFDLKALKIKGTPAASDVDNARYLLYECKGGYPIGVFCMYVRSSIPERGEKEMSQLFMMVGFDFFGSKTLSKMKFIRRIWESFHNRVTGNVGKRFKQLCEWQFDKFSNG